MVKINTLFHSTELRNGANLYPISDQTGQNLSVPYFKTKMVKIYTLFNSKMDKMYTLFQVKTAQNRTHVVG